MKKYIIIFFIIFFCLFSLIGLTLKQTFYILETITVGEKISLGPIIFYNYLDNSKIDAIYKLKDDKKIEEARKTMSPDEFKKWEPWARHTIRCSASFCGSTSEGYGLPFNHWRYLDTYGNPFHLFLLFLNLIIYSILAITLSKLICLFYKKPKIKQKLIN